MSVKLSLVLHGLSDNSKQRGGCDKEVRHGGLDIRCILRR